jgi:3D (Asp-Asp-Asp) domain-containing protein
MHKSIALLGLMSFISYSVLAPLQANAATVPPSVITNASNTADVMTNQVRPAQELTALPPKLSVTLTSYNAVAEQTSSTPWITASGAHSNPQVVAARSRDLAKKLPFGTIIAVLGPSSSDNGPYCGYDSVEHLIGYRVIADTMNARMHNKIDVMLDATDTVPLNGRDTNPSVALGACTGVKILVVGHVDTNHIPKTQSELAQVVTNSHHLALVKF